MSLRKAQPAVLLTTWCWYAVGAQLFVDEAWPPLPREPRAVELMGHVMLLPLSVLCAASGHPDDGVFWWRDAWGLVFPTAEETPLGVCSSAARHIQPLPTHLCTCLCVHRCSRSIWPQSVAIQTEMAALGEWRFILVGRDRPSTVGIINTPWSTLTCQKGYGREKIRATVIGRACSFTYDGDA